MASQRSYKRMKVYARDGGSCLELGEMEIWDGADLALLRDTMTLLVHKKRCRSLSVDMSYVKYVPSGFFGMLFDWFDRGVRIRLYHPQPQVLRMLWFKKFFVEVAPGAWDLQPKPVELDHEIMPAPLPLETSEEGTLDSPSEFEIPIAAN